MAIAPTTTTEYIWFGTRAVKFESGTNTGPQLEVLDDSNDFATRNVPSGTVDFTGSEWQQFLAFSGTADEMAALGVNVLDGTVDTATSGQVNTTGDLRVGMGVEAYNIADVGGGGRIVDTTNSLDDADDPIAITGLGKAGPNTLDSASIDAADTGNRVIFSNNIGFGFLGGSGFETAGNAVRINDGESINFEIKQGKQLLQASFTVKVLGGGSTEIVIDSDGATIRDTNAGLQGGFVQDGSAGELSLGTIADGTTVTINYENETIWFNGSQQFQGDLGAIVAFFDAFQAGGSKDLTLGSVVGNQIGWSADDLVLATDFAPVFIPALPTANGVISFRYTAPGSNTNADLEATLDIGKNGSIDAFETLATSFGGGGAIVGDADGDSNKAELKGTNTPFDILNLVTIGQQDANAPQGHQVGTLDRSLGIGIDTGAAGANLADGSSLGGNYGDEGAGGTNHLQNGEFIRFDLGANFEGVSAQIVFSANSLITRAGEDAVVRLLDSTGALVDQFAIDLDGGLTHVVSGGDVFDKVEIEALAGTQFAIADVDIDVVASFSPGAADTYDRIQLDVGNPGINERVDRAGDGLGFFNTGANPEYAGPETAVIGDVFTYFLLDGDPGDIRWRKPEGIYVTGDGDNNRDIDGPNGAVTISLKTGASLPDDGDANLLDDQVAFAFGGTIGFTGFGVGESVRFEFFSGGTEILEVDLLNDTAAGITSVNLDNLAGYDGQAFDSLRISAVNSVDQFNLQDITFNVFAF